jgi:hypothetical protein
MLPRCLNGSPSMPCARALARVGRKSTTGRPLSSFAEKQDKSHADGRGSPRKQSKAIQGHKDSGSINAPMTLVPDPIPQNGLSTHANPTQSTTLAVVRSTSHSLGSQTAVLKPLPPLLSTFTFASEYHSSTAPLPSATPSLVEKSPTDASNAHRIPVVMVAISVLGSALILLGLIIVIKAYSCPRHRMRPTPSLPICEDSFDDSQLKVESSPLFGGNERNSRPGSNGLWTWTQYPHPALETKSDHVAPHENPATSESPNFNEKGSTQDSYGSNDKNKSSFTGHGSGPAMTPANSFQQVSSVLTRVASRLSTTSISFQAQNPGNMPPLTADGHPVIERTSSSALKTMGRASEPKRGIKNVSRISPGSAYDGADVLSPQPASSPRVIAGVALAPLAATSGGRSRIKSTYYTPGAYPRVSVAPQPSFIPLAKWNFPSTKLTVPQQNLRRSEYRRARDTHALTLALGLDSPPLPASPQPTLYPDDSLSVVGEAQSRGLFVNEKETNRSYERPVTNKSRDDQSHGLGMMSPAAETNTALGNLMLMDYASTSKSLVSLPGRDVPTKSSRSLASLVPLRATGNLRRSFLTDDKPPRVPSPPPLPTLAQMGLAHANPESYTNYRSPTYSIYGLYENDRKSRVESFGY